MSVYLPIGLLAHQQVRQIDGSQRHELPMQDGHLMRAFILNLLQLEVHFIYCRTNVNAFAR